MSSALNRKSIFEAALGLKTKDRELLAEKLLRSLHDVDQQQLVQGAKLAQRRIRRSDRDASTLVSANEIMDLI
jgi:hypothetical protein